MSSDFGASGHQDLELALVQKEEQAHHSLLNLGTFLAAVSSWMRCVLCQLPELPLNEQEQGDGSVKHLRLLWEGGRGAEAVAVSSPSFSYPGKTVTVRTFPKGDVKGHALCWGA